MTDLLTQKQVLEQYQISYSSLHRYVWQGKLTEYRTPGGWHRYDPKEIEHLLRDIKRPTDDELQP